MKNQLKGFILGLFTATAIGTLGVTALAAANVIEINPISIMVNGKVFEPKDANGASVPVFTYNGTTYAPLRALGEAFGQKIGFDAVNNIATVGEVAVEKPTDTSWTAEEEKAYQEFKAVWDIKEYYRGINEISKSDIICYTATINNGLGNRAINTWWNSIPLESRNMYARQMARDLVKNADGIRIDFERKTIDDVTGGLPLGGILWDVKVSPNEPYINMQDN